MVCHFSYYLTVSLNYLLISFDFLQGISGFFCVPFGQNHPLIPSNFVILTFFTTKSGQGVAFFMTNGISHDYLNISDYM